MASAAATPTSSRPRPIAATGGVNEPLPEKIDVLIAGTGPAGLCLAAQLAQFPDIETMIVERMPTNIIKGKADGINTRTMEMFQAFGFADKVKRETYWVNQTNFWMPDPVNPAAHQTRRPGTGRGRRQLGDAAHPDQPGAVARAVPGSHGEFRPRAWRPTTAGRSWASPSMKPPTTTR